MCLVPTEEEGDFERPKTLMGRCQLPQWGQLLVDETHHTHLWGAEEQ